MKSGDLGELLDHVPTLVKAYGKWPSFLFVIFATALTSRLVLAAIVITLSLIG